ncbi:hypothetical protein PtA15_8A176 [Puccinia triticina]|uniref:Uncharacterized protein n=1 Tax=Puccinia triticina TaxID=208348 RepID=A0ABY7CTH4_9BASI|nr:uncharacterized protein PtA15_8A176 [Puccinia triticina]WAQ87272.1 hypothetical protein PtA15_8A176 [Puccinia triticina]
MALPPKILPQASVSVTLALSSPCVLQLLGGQAPQMAAQTISKATGGRVISSQSTSLCFCSPRASTSPSSTISASSPPLSTGPT